MTSLRAYCYLAVALVLPFGLGGCAAVLVGGVAAAGAAGGYMAGQERGLTGAVDDFTLKNNIESAWMQAKPPLAPNSLNATVYGGRVLLTGAAPDPQTKARALDMASRMPGVRGIYDKIAIGPGETTWEATKDAWITARLRSDLMFDSRVRSVNYTIETVNGTVYLIGSARTQAELNRVTNLARYVPDVKRVVSFVRIRPGVPALAQGAPLPPPGATGATGPAAAPVAPVTVQKL